MKNIKVSDEAHLRLKKMSVSAVCTMGRMAETLIRKTYKDVEAGKLKLKPVDLSEVNEPETLNV